MRKIFTNWQIRFAKYEGNLFDKGMKIACKDKLKLNILQRDQRKAMKRISNFTWDSCFKNCSTNRISPFGKNKATFPFPYKYEQNVMPEHTRDSEYLVSEPSDKHNIRSVQLIHRL